MVSIYSAGYRAAILLLICYRAYSHKSLTNLGVATAFVTGVIHSLAESSLYLNLVVLFFILGNISTKYKLQEKAKLTKTIVAEGSHTQRSHVQVLANSLPATLLILLTVVFKTDPQLTTKLLFGAVVNYAVAASDTWSSEFGMLSKNTPLLITTLKPCPKGTNGGVSSTGLLAGGAASLIIALVSIIVIGKSWLEKAILVASVSAFGILGTIIDSLIGAIFQRSYVDKTNGLVIENPNGLKVNVSEAKAEEFVKITGWDVLDNNGVNVATIFVTSGLSILYAWFLL